MAVKVLKKRRKETIRWETYAQTGAIQQRTSNMSDVDWICVVSDRK